MFKNQGFLKGTIWNLLGAGYEKVINYFLHIFIIKIFNVWVYGLFALTFAIFRILTRLGLFGAEAGTVFFVSKFLTEKKENKLNELLKFFLLFFPAIGITISFTIFSISGILEKNVFNKEYLAIFLWGFCLGFPFSLLAQGIGWATRGFGTMKYFVGIIQIIRPTLNILIIYLIFLFTRSVIAIPGGYSFSFVIAASIFVAITLKRNPYLIKEKIKKDTVINYIAFTFPIIFMEFSREAAKWVDVIMLGILKTVEDVGFYNAAVRTSDFLLILIWVFSPVFSPICASCIQKKDYSELKKAFHKTLIASLIFTFPLLFLFYIKGDLILSLLFKKEFSKMHLVLIFMSSANLFVALQSPFTCILIMSKEQKKWAKYVFGALILNIILNYIFIKTWGAVGAALATSLSILFLVISSFILVKNKKFFSLDIKILLTFIIWELIILIFLYFLNITIENEILKIFLIGITGYILSTLYLIFPPFLKKYLK